jgi:hypothetical protein
VIPSGLHLWASRLPPSWPAIVPETQQVLSFSDSALWLLYQARQRARPSAPVLPSAPTDVGAGSAPGGGGDRPTGARPKGRPSESRRRKPADAVQRVDRRRGKGAVHGEEVRIYIDPDEEEVTFKS